MFIALWVVSMIVACAIAYVLPYLGARYPDRWPGIRVAWSDWRNRNS